MCSEYFMWDLINVGGPYHFCNLHTHLVHDTRYRHEYKLHFGEMYYKMTVRMYYKYICRINGYIPWTWNYITILYYVRLWRLWEITSTIVLLLLLFYYIWVFMAVFLVWEISIICFYIGTTDFRRGYYFLLSPILYVIYSKIIVDDLEM
jgi:hypothetical protein